MMKNKSKTRKNRLHNSKMKGGGNSIKQTISTKTINARFDNRVFLAQPDGPSFIIIFKKEGLASKLIKELYGSNDNYRVPGDKITLDKYDSTPCLMVNYFPFDKNYIKKSNFKNVESCNLHIRGT